MSAAVESEPVANAVLLRRFNITTCTPAFVAQKLPEIVTFELTNGTIVDQVQLFMDNTWLNALQPAGVSDDWLELFWSYLLHTKEEGSAKVTHGTCALASNCFTAYLAGYAERPPADIWRMVFRASCRQSGIQHDISP